MLREPTHKPLDVATETAAAKAEDCADATSGSPPSVPVASAPVPSKSRRRPRRSRPRSVTVPQREDRTVGNSRARAYAALLDVDRGAPAEFERPQTRGDCRNAVRPCPFAGCKFHLFLDVNPDTGSIKLNFPDLEPWELRETCALDVADRGGITLEEVGEIMNLTRERIRQVEVRGLIKLKMQSPTPDELGAALLDAVEGDDGEGGNE